MSAVIRTEQLRGLSHSDANEFVLGFTGATRLATTEHFHGLHSGGAAHLVVVGWVGRASTTVHILVLLNGIFLINVVVIMLLVAQ